MAEEWTTDALKEYLDTQVANLQSEITEAKSGRAATINWWLTGASLLIGVGSLLALIIH